MFGKIRAALWPLAMAIAFACAPYSALAQDKPVMAPAGYVPQYSISYGDTGSIAQAVSAAFPLPVWCVTGCGGGGSGGGGGAGTEFAEDTPHASGALGTLALGVRKDTAASLAGSDGDYTAPIFDANGKLWVNPGTIAVTGTFWQATQPVSGTFWQATQPVSLTSQPLPTGAATSAAQVTAQTSLTSIDGKLVNNATTTLQAVANASLATIDADLGSPIDTAYAGTGAAGVTSVLKGIYSLLNQPAAAIPARALTPAGALIIGHVNKSTTGATTIVAADPAKAFSIYGVLISVGGPTTLTFKCGVDDLVLDVPSAGILDLAFREYPYCVSTVNTAMSLTSSSAVALKGKLYVGKE